MGRDPAEGVRNKELVVSWKAGGPGLGDGFGEGEGQCDVGVFWPEKAVDDGRGCVPPTLSCRLSGRPDIPDA